MSAGRPWAKSCAVCGVAFTSQRSDKKTCTDRCRKRLSDGAIRPYRWNSSDRVSWGQYRESVRQALYDHPELSHEEIAERVGGATIGLVDNMCRREVARGFACAHVGESETVGARASTATLSGR
jgi:hypothetical protein